MMSCWHYQIGKLGLVIVFLGMMLIPFPITRVAVSEETKDKHPSEETLLTQLGDGTYQFCTEPDSGDWRDGAGVCLHIVKQGMFVEGYYGYPHSDSFVCLQGQVSEDTLQGEGFVISWAGHVWPDIPQEEFIWDQDGRLTLANGELVERDRIDDEQVDWIVFRQASLNMQGLYLYSESRMTPPNQLCAGLRV